MANEIAVELVLDGAGRFVTEVRKGNDVLRTFRSTTGEAGAQITDMARRVTEYTRSQRLASTETKDFIGSLRDVSIVVGAASLAVAGAGRMINGWLGSIVKVNAEFERLEYLMRGMSTAANPIEDAKNRLEVLKKTATEVPFSMNAIADSMAKLQATGTDPLGGSLKSLMDGVAAFGGSDEVFKRATLAITQMSGKGVIQMEELRQQLGEAMPEAVQIMARSLGVSMPKLLKDISTGTVSAEKALKYFYLEVDRAFGGSAAAQMETFNGKIRLMETTLQNLALTVGNEGFMEELTKQLGDLIEMLQSTEMENFAKSFGAGLQSALQTLRSVIDFTIKFRDEIVNAGTAMATAFVLTRAISGIQALSTKLAVTRAEFKALRQEQNLAAMFNSLGTAAQGAGTTLVTTGRAATGVGLGISVIGRAITTSLPLVGLLVTAITFAATSFDWFNTKGQKAYETIADFGKAAREEFEAAKDYAKEQTAADRELIAEEERNMKRRENARTAFIARYRRQMFYGAAGDERRAEIDRDAGAEYDRDYAPQAAAEMQAAQQRISEAQARISAREGAIYEASTKLAEDENNKVLQSFEKRLEKELNAGSAAYRQKGRDLEASFNEERQKAIANGKSTELIDNKFAEDMKKRSLDLYAAQNKILDNYIVEQTQKLEDARRNQNAQAVDQAELLLGLLGRKLEENKAAMQTVQEQMSGDYLLKGGINDKMLFGKGQTKLYGLTDEIAGLRAELTGAKGEAGELASALARGVYGDSDRIEVQKLIEALKEAQAEKDALDDLMKGKKALEGDIKNARIKWLSEIAENEAELAGKTLTDAERIKIKWESGGYEGLGPNSAMQRGLREVAALTGGVQTKTEDAARAIQENAFGDPSLTKINTFNDALQQVASSLTLIGMNAGNINFDNMRLPGQAGAGFETMNDQLAAGPTRYGDGAAGIIMANHGTRNKPLSVNLEAALSAAIAKTGLTVKVFSGGQDATGPNRVGSHRHDHGNAADINVLQGNRMLSWENRNDIPMLQAFMAELKRQGLTGFGAAGNYMGDKATHVGYGSEAIWGKKGGGAPYAALVQALENVARAPTVQRAAAEPAPAAKPVTNVTGGPSIGGTMSALSQASSEWIKEQIATITKWRDSQLGDISDLQKRAESGDQDVALKKILDDTRAAQEGLKKNAGEYGDNVKQFREMITDGKFGKSAADRDPNNSRYAEQMKALEALDALEKEQADRKSARNKVENAEQRMKLDGLELEKRSREAMARIQDPNELKSSSAYRNVREDWEKHLAEVEAYYGRDTDAYKAALVQRDNALKNFRNVEIQEKAASWAQQTQQGKIALMTESQQRQANLELQIQQIDAYVAQFKGSEEEMVQVVAAAEAQKAQLRQQAMQATPMGAMMKDWGDLYGNLEQAQTKWIDGFASGIAGMITGTGDLKSAINGMINDIVNMGVRYLISQLMSGKNQVAGAASGGGKKGAQMPGKGGGAKGAMPFKTAHTGGIIGASSLATSHVNPRLFATAKKYHTGGVIGGRSLLPSEVPIIAKKGEGVFTPEQMKALGGARGGGTGPVSISSNVTVNANGGTQEQNDDLAKKVSKQVEAQMRAVVQQEMRNAQRPGNR